MANISNTLDDFKAHVMGTLGLGTCRVYVRALQRLIGYAGDKEAGELTLKDFAGYKMKLATARRSNSYVAGELAAFCSYLDFLKKTYGQRPVDPEDVRDLRPRVRPGEPKPLEPWQYDQVVESAETIGEKALVVLLFNTGLRISEMTSLTKDSVIEREVIQDGHAIRVRWLHVVGKGRKPRSVPLNQEAEDVLRKYMEFLDLKSPKGYSMLFPWSYTSVWRQIKRVGRRAGIEVHPHMLRHTFATELLKRGENIVTIARIMGHESLDTTRKYTKIVDAATVTAVRRLEQ